MDSKLFVREQPGGMYAIRDATIITGTAFWVGSAVSGATDGSGYGRNPDAPFATIDYAVNQTTANAGDVIYVLPGHAESLTAAAAIDIDVAGVKVIGLGDGSKRPTITMAHADATVEMAGANCTIQNVLFISTADSTIVLDVNAADCSVVDCEFRYSTGKEFVTAIDINGGAANACDRTLISGCVFMSPVAGADRAIELGEVADSVVIENCSVWGDYADAGIHNITGKVMTNLMIRDCFVQNTQTGDHAVELVSACTGMLLRNAYYSDIAAPGGVDPGSCFSVECYHADAIDTSGILAPVAT
jgi:hypothetical protein